MTKHNSSMKLRTTRHLLQTNPMQNVNNLLLNKNKKSSYNTIQLEPIFWIQNTIHLLT